MGSYGRRRADILATLEWAAAGKLKAAIGGIYPLAETRAAFDALRQRQVMGRSSSNLKRIKLTRQALFGKVNPCKLIGPRKICKSSAP